MNRLITYLIRRKLGLKKEQQFYLRNQKNKKERYFFMDGKLYKVKCYGLGNGRYVRSWVASNMSLDFLLSNEIKGLLVKE